MSATVFRNYPPYQGAEPYLYLCFHHADAKMVKPVLEELTKHRCRVWYCFSGASSAKENRDNVRYEKNASLMVFWLSDSAARDENMKSAIGYFQTTGRPVICLDRRTNTERSGFSLILDKNARILRSEPDTSVEVLVSTLMRTEGFTHLLIAENDSERQIFLHKRKSRIIALSILFAAAALMVCAFLYAQSNNWFRPEIVVLDSMSISDPEIRRAAKAALSEDGSVALTPESIFTITTLRIETPPASFGELSLFPSLARLEIPQSCVDQAAALLDGAQYDIVVYPEAAS